MTTTVLDQTSAMTELADTWETAAKARRRWGPDTDPAAETLEKCAADLREVANQLKPEWVPISVVIAATGVAKTSLIRRCKQLVDAGRARFRGKRWELTTDAALEIVRKSPKVNIEGVKDLAELARRLGRDPG